MNLVNHPIGAAELKVSGIADFSLLGFHRCTTAITVHHGQLIFAALLLL
jgi:hypothetical protein